MDFLCLSVSRCSVCCIAKFATLSAEQPQFIPDDIADLIRMLYFNHKSQFGNTRPLGHNYNLPLFQRPSLEKPGKKHGHGQNLNVKYSFLCYPRPVIYIRRGSQTSWQSFSDCKCNFALLTCLQWSWWWSSIHILKALCCIFHYMLKVRNPTEIKPVFLIWKGQLHCSCSFCKKSTIPDV